MSMSIERETHVLVMQSILNGLVDTPLVLKGGTALMLGYGLDRFSEDLDFDSDTNINLCHRIQLPAGIKILAIDVLKNTKSVSRYRLLYSKQNESESNVLKIEVSYRNPPQKDDSQRVNGIQVLKIHRIIDQKLLAAFDGKMPRSKVRDLYDLDFLVRKYAAEFDNELMMRLFNFAGNPDSLVVKYKEDYEEDVLIKELIDLDSLALNIHCEATKMIETSRLHCSYCGQADCSGGCGGGSVLGM